ncbi:D-alanyl-D-alanine carboxypeptidase, partial [Mycobacterium sp. CBMA361]|nr:D-alanyl-D-alanine carboxypeptidase [Mycolicibacterium sp. CBMA 361]
MPIAVVGGAANRAAAEPTGQPASAQALANGPAKAWLVAD